MALINPFIFDYLQTPFDNHPGIPIQLEGLAESAQGLLKRRDEMKPALDGLSRTYTIQGNTHPASEFLYGTSPDRFITGLNQLLSSVQDANPLSIFKMFLGDLFKMQAETSGLTRLSLDSTAQFDISITNFGNAFQDAQPMLPGWEATLQDADVASERFWPNIADNGLAYNLLFLKKVVSEPEQSPFKAAFGASWKAQWTQLAAAGQLFAIDLSIFSRFPSASVDGVLRFTPGTITLLQQNPDTKTLTPLAVLVEGYQEADVPQRRVFVRSAESSSHWIYALQAAKTSVTVYGIWLGHVYHWHIVTAALVKSMTKNLPKSHPIFKLLAPQTNYLLQFDELLILLWKFIAPPTSFDTADSFYQLLDAFAEGRNFFDDDPATALSAQGIQKEDFSVTQDWDSYSIVSYYLEMYQASTDYVGAIVDEAYPDNTAVKNDKALQAWMKEAADKNAGNVRGLPNLNTKAALKRLLTSLIYRVTMHGCSRLRKSLSPVLSYLGNYPVCLQREDIPGPGDNIQLLKYMPKTGTIGLMVRFYGIFIYSDPYESLIPEAGIETDLYFAKSAKDPRNQALLAFRIRVKELMHRWQPEREQLQQWPRGIET